MNGEPEVALKETLVETDELRRASGARRGCSPTCATRRTRCSTLRRRERPVPGDGVHPGDDLGVCSNSGARSPRGVCGGDQLLDALDYCTATTLRCSTETSSRLISARL